MKKIAIAIGLSFLLFGSTNADTTTSSGDFCELQIEAWEAELNGISAYFSSPSCARNAGATNIQYAGFQSHCMVFICFGK